MKKLQPKHDRQLQLCRSFNLRIQVTFYLFKTRSTMTPKEQHELIPLKQSCERSLVQPMFKRSSDMMRMPERMHRSPHRKCLRESLPHVLFAIWMLVVTARAL